MLAEGGAGTRLAMPSTKETQPMPQKIVIDTDIGDDVDDAIAVGFALRWPEVEVLAFTTCHVVTQKRCRMLAKLLKAFGAEGVPVAPGLTRPMRPMPPDEAARMEAERPWQYAFVREGGPDGASGGPGAVETLYAALRAHPGEVVLVAIGPLTNVADLLRVHPDAAGLAKAIAVMGGGADKREYNFACDPEAARFVLHAPARVFVGTWEVTKRVVLLEDDVAALASSADPGCRALAENIELWRPHQGKKAGPVIYDMSPILWTVRPDMFTTEQRRMDMALDGPERGMCVQREGAPVVEATTDMRHEDARGLLMEVIAG